MRKILRAIMAGIAAMVALFMYVYLSVPDVRPLRTGSPATTAFMQLRAREAQSRGQPPKRVQHWVSYDRISPHLSRAVLVAEDSAYWKHTGIDIEQIRESMQVNFERREFARGASTITQQLAKNLYLSPSKNPMRKLRELFIARRLEAELSKRRILELYLNVIEWGDGIYGAEAASRRYFGSSAAALTPEQAALLAGAIINPRLLNPGRPTARLRRRQRMILRRMGMVTPPPPAPAQRVESPFPEGTPTDPDVVPGAPISAEPPPPTSEPPVEPIPLPPVLPVPPPPKPEQKPPEPGSSTATPPSKPPAPDKPPAQA